MKKHLYVSAILSLFVAAPARAQGDAPPRALIIGDSISIGYTPHVRELLEGLVEVRHNEGNAQHTGTGLSRIKEWLGEERWDVIHFNWGLWDLCYRNREAPNPRTRDKTGGTLTTPLDQYEANLQELVTVLEGTGARLIWANTTPVPEGEPGRFQGDELKYNAAAQRVMAAHGIPIDDLWSRARSRRETIHRADGDVHFTPEGSAFLARQVAGLIYDSCYPDPVIEPTTEPLWPGAEQIGPTLTIYLPPKPKAVGTAVVICPGGGYGHLAMGHEGHDVARWLTSFGVVGVIVEYRHRGTGFGGTIPFEDARRAMQIVRSRAKELGVEVDRIGIMGFSAGGHLASTVGTHFDEPPAEVGDEIDSVSCRPDFMILVYPVITFSGAFTHRGSRRNLLGDDPTPELVEYYSSELQVTKRTPPTFLVHADDDRGVPPENSIAIYGALREAGISAEMHIFKEGGHGFGLGRVGGVSSAWPGLCEAWMKGLGVLDVESPSPDTDSR
jgi:acetyl esterase/lipase